MLHKTLSPHFWTHEFTVGNQKLDFLYSELAEGILGVPAPFDQMAISLIRECQDTENRQVQNLLERGTLYKPCDRYEVGQVLVFTALDFRAGTVTDVRPGYNPEHGDFDVIQVTLEDPEETLEFAARLTTDHPLNALDTAELHADSLMTADEIHDQFGEEIETQIRLALEQGDRAGEFLEWQGGWLLKDSLVTIDEFSRNVAEAKMFEVNRPVSSQEILDEINLDTGDMPLDLVDLSLEIGLAQDARFTPVSVAGETRWFTRSLLPEAAQTRPPLLQPVPINYQFSPLDGALLQLEDELQDEWSEGQNLSEAPGFASIHLLYPHWQNGTLPVTSQVVQLLQLPGPNMAQFEIRDPLHGHRMPCWYVPEGRYICGLGEYYTAHNIPVGARLRLERQADGTLDLNYNQRRGRREWIHFLNVKDGVLQYRMEKSKANIACEHHPQLLVTTEAEEVLAQYRAEQIEQKLFLLVEDLVQELVKDQGEVHAATVYGVVNLLQRHAPGPVFHALISNSRLQQLDDQLTFKLAMA